MTVQNPSRVISASAVSAAIRVPGCNPYSEKRLLLAHSGGNSYVFGARATFGLVFPELWCIPGDYRGPYQTGAHRINRNPLPESQDTDEIVMLIRPERRVDEFLLGCRLGGFQ